jgi:hypothetical protein
LKIQWYERYHLNRYDSFASEYDFSNWQQW